MKLSTKIVRKWINYQNKKEKKIRFNQVYYWARWGPLGCLELSVLHHHQSNMELSDWN